MAKFWIFGNFLATFWHFSEQLFSILRAQSGKAYSLPSRMRMGPEIKKHHNNRTNKQTSFIPLFAVKTELSSDKINNNDTIIYIKCNETNLRI